MLTSAAVAAVAAAAAAIAAAEQTAWTGRARRLKVPSILSEKAHAKEEGALFGGDRRMSAMLGWLQAMFSATARSFIMRSFLMARNLEPLPPRPPRPPRPFLLVSADMPPENWEAGVQS